MTTYNISEAKLKSIIKSAILNHVDDIQEDIFSLLEGYTVNSEKPLKIGVSKGEKTEVIGIPSELSKMNVPQLEEYIMKKGWKLPPDSERNKKGNFLKSTLTKYIKTQIAKDEDSRSSSKKKSRSKSREKSRSRSRTNDVNDVTSRDILPEEEGDFEDVEKTSKQEPEGIDEIAQDEVDSYFTGEATVEQYRAYLRAVEKYGEDVDRISRHTGIPKDIIEDIIENPIYYDNMVSKIDVPKTQNKNYGSNLQQIKPSFGGKKKY